MKKAANICFLLCFLGIFYTIPVLLLGQEEQSVSYYENRFLAHRPELSRESFFSGEYFSGWESWLSDHMPKRDRTLQVNTALEKDILVRPSVNGVTLGEGMLLSAFSRQTWDPAAWYSIFEPICEDFASLSAEVEAQGGEFFFVGIPWREAYLTDRYPRCAAPDEENIFCHRDAFVSGLRKRDVAFIDVKEAYEATGLPGEALYSAGDHHFSFLGALVAYQAAMEAVNARTGLDLTVLKEEDLELVSLPNHYMGSYARKLYDLWDKEDVLTVGNLKEPIPYQRWDNSLPTNAPLYALPGSETETVTYTVYMGGDWAETVLKTDRPELPNCLIFGDSYTNAMEPLFYASFNETHILDLRYYTEKSLREYIREYGPDVVLCVRDENDWGTTTGNGAVWDR